MTNSYTTTLGIFVLIGAASGQQVDSMAAGSQASACVPELRDSATGACIGASSVPTQGMLYPLGPDFHFDQFGQLRLGNTLVVDGNIVGGVMHGTSLIADGDDLTVVNGGRLGVGTLFPDTDIHIERTGSVQLRLEADRNNTNEFAHPVITFYQDGGAVTSFIGYSGGGNNLILHANNDSDMLFRLPHGGTADWEYHKRTGGTTNVLGVLNDVGSWHIDGNYHSGGADVAEYYPVHGAVEPGDVVAFRGVGIEIERATGGTSNARRLAGIVSSDPGVVLGLSYSDETQGDEPSELFDGDRYVRTPAGHTVDHAILHEIDVNRRAPLALTGRVPCRVSAEGGAIRPGDPLTAASLPGHARKATEPGPVIGTALEAWDAGEGTILVFANLGWYSPTTELEKRIAELEQRLERLTHER